MDWKRVESILIVALVITNAIVVFALYNSRYLSHSEILDFEQREKIVIDLLKQNNIIVNTKLDKSSSLLPNIHLTYETYDDEGFISLLLGNKYEKVDNKYISDDAQIIIKNEQNLIYKKTIIPSTSIIKSDKEFANTNFDDGKFNKAYSMDILLNKNLRDDEIFAIGIAEDFLKEKGIKSLATQFGKVIKLDINSYCVKYRQYEDGRFLEDAYMDLIIIGDQVVELDRKWFGEIVQVGSYSEIESPLVALFRLISIMDEEGNISENRRIIKSEEDSTSDINNMISNLSSNFPIKIVSLELVYRLVSDIVPIRFLEGDSTLYWRIELDTGKVVYMKAKEIRE